MPWEPINPAAPSWTEAFDNLLFDPLIFDAAIFDVSYAPNWVAQSDGSVTWTEV